MEPEPARGKLVVSSSPHSNTAEFDALYEQLRPSLWRYVHRLVGDGDVADDIVQEAFVKLLGRSDLPAGEARMWTFTVATNLVRDRGRAAVRHARLLAVTPPEVERPRPADERVEREETVNAVRRALDHLSERDRQLLLMREEGFRYHEMAAAVGVAPSSVGVLIARAVKRFTQVYTPVVE